MSSNMFVSIAVLPSTKRDIKLAASKLNIPIYEYIARLVAADVTS